MNFCPAHEVFGNNKSIDFSAHNAEVEALWKAYNDRRPPRVPMIIGANCRIIVLNKELNPEGVTFRDVFTDPAIMLEVALRFAYYMRFFLPSDRPMGMPEHWTATAITMNTFEAEWFGAELEFIDGDTPDCRPFLSDDNKNMLFDRGVPNPFVRNAAFTRDCCEYFQDLIDKGFMYENLPLAKVYPPSFVGTDGPFTVACAIRGAAELCCDLYEDPGYVHALLSYITESTIERIKAWRRLFGLSDTTPDDAFFIPDDSIALLSPEMYCEFVMPYHKKLVNALGNSALPTKTHLCGDATRHFKTMRDELNTFSFDTGFPIDHGAMVQILGPNVEILGGPPIYLLLNGTPDEVKLETERILFAVMKHTKRFILREGNNLPPCTPAANIAAMYETAKRMQYLYYD